MSPRVTMATTLRVLQTLRRDHRTVGLLLVVPCVLETLFRYVFDAEPQLFQRVGLPLVGVFPLISMFLVSSVTMLRERTSGTLERLMTTPLKQLDLLLGYGIAFAMVAVVQATLACAVSLGPLGLQVHGSASLLVVIAVLDAILGMALGLLVSAFARSEFQAVQFLPAVLLPQLLLCGLFAPRSAMATALQWVADALPLTYAFDGLSRVGAGDGLAGVVVVDLSVVAGAALLALGLGAATLRRRSA